MSIYDRFRQTAARQFEKYGSDATLSRTIPGTLSLEDRAKGRVANPNAEREQIDCRAILSQRRYRAEDGTYRFQSVALIDVQPIPGDMLVVGNLDQLVRTVEEINPDGTSAIIFTVTLE